MTQVHLCDIHRTQNNAIEWGGQAHTDLDREDLTIDSIETPGLVSGGVEYISGCTV
jgi:hypothetical protein